MKTELPKQSHVITERLKEITREILVVAKDKIAMIILFGSYAKGSWVKNWYVEDDILYSYESDIDIMVVTKKAHYSGFHGSKIRNQIERKLEQEGIFFGPTVTIIVEPIQRLNRELEKSQYFFSDIIKEGIVLYDSGEFKLAEARELSQEERKEKAINEFEQWFPQGLEFLTLTYNAFKYKYFNRSAFLLHQATESFYTAILLVFTGYKEKIHDIKILGSLASNYNDELLKIFPRDTEEQRECFKLLREAYIRARYDKKYSITKEQLSYLISRVEKLKEVTEKICEAQVRRK